MFNRIAAIAINTFREAVRDRVLAALLGTALFILLFTLAIAELSLHQQRRVVLDIGLGSISLFSVIASIFLGSSLLYKEIERKTLYVILPKPVRRFEFLLGKYFGIALTALVFIAIMGSVQLWVTAIQADAVVWAVAGPPAAAAILLAIAMRFTRDRTSALVPWSLASLLVFAAGCWGTDVPVAFIISSLLLILGEVLVLSAVALLFSSFSTPLLTALFSVGVWLAGRSADTMVTMKSKLLAPIIKATLKLIAEVIPNFNLFVPSHALMEKSLDNFAAPLAYLATTLGYAAMYSAIVLAFAAFVFRRRDLV
jgi:Cu-processing system permease protein